MFLPHNASSDLFLFFFLFIIRPALDLLGASSYDTLILRIDDPTNCSVEYVSNGYGHPSCGERPRTLFIVAMTELCCSLLFHEMDG